MNQKKAYTIWRNENIEAFVRLAETESLLVILRPSAYIFAEWSFWY